MVLVLGAVLCGPAVFAQQSTLAAAPLQLNVTLTWDLGLRIGLDYRPWDHVGFSADVGSSLLGLEGSFALTWDAFVVLHAFGPEEPWQLSACLGVVDGHSVFVTPMASEISFGASVQGSYRVTESLAAFLRLGEGVPFYVQEGEFARDDVSFPFGLWPDISLGMKLSL